MADLPAYVFIPVQRSSSPGEPPIHGRHRLRPRQRVMRLGPDHIWTVMPLPSTWRCVARALRATLWA